jgi:sporulation protein YabP
MSGADMEEKNVSGAGLHKFLLQGRKTAEFTGVKEVVSFDAKEVVLNTTMGALIIRGNDLFVKRLTVEKGEVDLEGRIDSFVYADKPGKTGDREPVLKRLFR